MSVKWTARPGLDSHGPVSEITGELDGGSGGKAKGGTWSECVRARAQCAEQISR